ncbi:hypothetical protein OG338_08355 [Streptomyces sp. NBC_00726]|uniref:hypothetical protein n=1 Tax=Streptomyces sp. NBC_00726 TaxID=2903674 RepID=UPI003868CC0E
MAPPEKYMPAVAGRPDSSTRGPWWRVSRAGGAGVMRSAEASIRDWRTRIAAAWAAKCGA